MVQGALQCGVLSWEASCGRIPVYWNNGIYGQDTVYNLSVPLLYSWGPGLFGYPDLVSVVKSFSELTL